MTPNNPFFTSRTRCPVCDGANLVSLYKRSYQDPWMREYISIEYQGRMETQYLAGLHYEIVECRVCGFLFQSDVPNEAGVKRLFEIWIKPDFIGRTAETALGHRSARALLSFAARYLGRPGLRMLDYGAGLGGLCAHARELGMEVSAVENAAPYFDALRQRGFHPMSPGQEEEGCYDFVVCDQVIEHVPHPFKVVQALHRTLKQDGLLFLEVHNCGAVKRRLRMVDSLPIRRYKAALEPCAAIQHMNCFTNRTLKRLGRRAGFEPVFRPFMFLRHGIGWNNPGHIPKDIARPFYRHYLSTSLFFRKTV